MRIDERVFIMGEDIQKGVYGASGGLFQEFGGERVRDCPLVGERLLRRGGWRGGGGDAPHRREPVQLHVGGHGPAGQPGVEDALHVRRPGQPAHRVPRRHVLRRQHGRPPLRPLAPAVHEHPRLQDRLRQQRLRRQGAAQVGHPHRRPGDLLGGPHHPGRPGRGPGGGVHNPPGSGRHKARGYRRHHRRHRRHGAEGVGRRRRAGGRRESPPRS